MATNAELAERTIREFILRIKEVEVDDLTAPLFGDEEGAIGLDSMDTAELSAILEDELGTDPYSEGQVPQTAAEIIAFYG